MSTDLGEEIFNIGARLREERVRMGMSQEIMGTRIGTTSRTIKKYEGNETSPRATELLQLSSLGADVLYIVTGIRLPLGVAETRNCYTASEHLAQFIADLALTDDDAALLKTMAVRLTR